MKNLFVILFIVAIAICSACNNAANQQTENTDTTTVANGMAEIQFEQLFYNFGSIYQGEQVSYTFKFKNTGSANLIIERVETTCGCTASEYNREPVKPGTSGEIKVKFDSSGKSGKQFKTVIITSNTEPKRVELVMEGEVIVKN